MSQACLVQFGRGKQRELSTIHTGTCNCGHVKKKENGMRFFAILLLSLSSCFNHETTSAQPNGPKTLIQNRVNPSCENNMRRISWINPLLLHLAVTYSLVKQCYFVLFLPGRVRDLQLPQWKNSEKKRNRGTAENKTCHNGASCWCTSTLRQLLRLSRGRSR